MLWPQDHKPSYHFLDPGDRFIPTRSLMDIERAKSLLTPMKQKGKPKNLTTLPSREEYMRRLEENLTMDAEGKPFKMLVFKGSPRNSKKNGTEFEEERFRRRIWKLPKVRTIDRHLARVGSLSWNGNILTSGSHNTCIFNHDVRVFNRPAAYYKGHREEVCGLKMGEERESIG